jgi:cytochrome c oxidase subunit 4
MSKPTNAPKPEGYDWDDPHGFHEGSPVGEDGHHHEEHHVSSWQLNVAILFVLLFFTFLTVLVAKGEVILTTYTDFPITQLWNVIIAMSIATVKAMLVMMYFMHLRHDKPLNSMVMLFTFATMGLFMTFPAIDIASREAVKDYGLAQIVPGGSGAGMSRWNGADISGSIVEDSRNRMIAKKGEDAYWKYFYNNYAHYHHGDVPRHYADENNIHAKWIEAGGGHHADHAADHAEPERPVVSDASRTIVRTGLTPGLFSAEAPADHGDQHGEDHSDDKDHEGADHGSDGDQATE